MHVFVTGASGWIGSATVTELLASGHRVTGLARSEASAERLKTKGADVLRGDLADLETLRRGATAADAVVHLAYNHDWSDTTGAGATNRAAVQTIGNALAGTGRPLMVASGVALLPGKPATEDDLSPLSGPDAPRGGGENLAFEYADQGVRSVALRFAPTVHGTGDYGFIAILAAVAREKGVSGYPGDGSNGWSAVHVSDAARLITLGLDKAPARAALHAVAEESVPTRRIAEAIGRAFDLPVAPVAHDQLEDHFGWIGQFFAMDLSATSAKTRELLGWTPTGPDLITDLDTGAYTPDAAPVVG